MRRRKQKAQVKQQIIEFKIDHLDPLGKGVSKLDGTVTFVAGTLPGETGTATVHKRASGVQFASLLKLDKIADNRIEPECPHFSQCPGCQFLHTDYDSELRYKKAALVRQLGFVTDSENQIEVVRAPRRLAYRNRMQLHYRHKYIGMLDTIRNEVLQVPQCKILRPELQDEFDRLYRGEWVTEHQGQGHCELYFREGEVSINWDDTYAQGGFSQVFEEMNEVLQQCVQSQLDEISVVRLLDLFSGTGNLSDRYAASGGDRVLVDRYIDIKGKNVHQLDLYDPEALSQFTRKTGTSGFDTLLVDPPRRGFPNLDAWAKKIKPQHLVYVSCNPASLARDLRDLGMRFKFKSIQLLDLFPATAHFETIVLLEFRKGRS